MDEINQVRESGGQCSLTKGRYLGVTALDLQLDPQGCNGPVLEEGHNMPLSIFFAVEMVVWRWTLKNYLNFVHF